MHADKVLVKICLTLLTDTNPDFMKKGISYRCAQNVNAEFLGGNILILALQLVS